MKRIDLSFKQNVIRRFLKGELDRKEFLILVGIVNTLVMALSFIILFDLDESNLKSSPFAILYSSKLLLCEGICSGLRFVKTAKSKSMAICLFCFIPSDVTSTTHTEQPTSFIFLISRIVENRPGIVI